MQRRWLLLSAFACGAVLAAPQAVVAELTIVGGAVPPAARNIVVQQGDHVLLRITSDTIGEMHVHAYRLAARVGPGGFVQLGFDAQATGRFPVEWHAGDDAAHAAPIAWLEVRPR